MKNGNWFYSRIIKLRSLALSALVSLFVITTLLIFGPIEAYYHAADDIPFSMKQILAISIFGSVIVFLVLIIAFSLLRGKVHQILVCFLFSLGIGLYMQANFMNADYGLLDGHAIDWSSYGNYGSVNSIIWAFIIIIPIVILMLNPPLILKVMKYISAFLIVVQFITLGVLLLSQKATLTKIDVGLSNEGIYEVGSKNNVIVFIPDTFDTQYMDYLVKNNPEYLTELTGFTYFRNSVGSFPKTEGAVPFLLSGKYYINEVTREAYRQTAYSSSALLSALSDAGYDTRVYTTVDASDIGPYVENELEIEYFPGSYFELGKMMGKLVLFRYAPHNLKQYFWLYSGDFQTLISKSSDILPYVIDDVSFYSKLASKGLTAGSYTNAFRFIHLYGCHEPYTINADVEYTKGSYASPVEQLKGMMTILNTYIRQLKALGLYDDATIIVMGDHGGNQVTQPVFLAKPPKAVGEINVSNSPISQLDFHATVMSCAGLPTVTYGNSVFDIAEDSLRERTFYMYNIHSANMKGYMPIMWEQEFLSDNLQPYFTHQVFAHGDPQNAAELASPIKFNILIEAKDLIKYFSPGFMSWGDDTYIWGNGRSGVMYFKVPSVPVEGVTITFQWISYFTTPSQRLIIKSGDDLLFDQEFMNGRSNGTKVHIPAEYIDADGTILLDVFCPLAESGLNLGIAGGVRLQNFGFNSITISEGNTNTQK